MPYLYFKIKDGAIAKVKIVERIIGMAKVGCMNDGAPSMGYRLLISISPLEKIKRNVVIWWSIKRIGKNAIRNRKVTFIIGPALLYSINYKRLFSVRHQIFLTLDKK